MKKNVLYVDEKIEDDDTGDNGKPEWHVDIVEKPPAPLRGHQGETDGHQGEEDADDQRADRHDAEVVEPASGFRRRQQAAGCPSFQEGERQQGSEKKPQPDDGFVFQHGSTLFNFI
jgi:hypothetical protein